MKQQESISLVYIVFYIKNLFVVTIRITIQSLISKSLQTKEVMDVVVKTINFIRSRGLHHRQFTSFLADMDFGYSELLYPTEGATTSIYQPGADLEHFGGGAGGTATKIFFQNSKLLKSNKKILIKIDFSYIYIYLSHLASAQIIRKDVRAL